MLRTPTSRPSVLSLTGLLLATTPGCGVDAEPPPAGVVLVLVDQLRHDAVDRWMPKVSALAEQGVVFDRMRASAPWTYPSVVSMFSGLYPQQHGADGQLDGGQELSVFDADVPLLPRTLTGDTYTAGFVTNPFFQTWNPLHEAFDHYEVDAFIGSQGNLRGHPELVWTARMYADTVNREVIEHFDARPLGEPEFVYVHYIDVHGPWDDAPFDVGGADHRRTEDDAYETATRYVDERIVELYDYFAGRYGGDMVFCVTSDHGQELGDDLLVGEGLPVRQRKATVHDFNTRIPFLLLPSGRIPAGRAGARIDAPCSNVDVAPTLLEWTGHDLDSRIAGQSLLPLIRGDGAGGNPRAIYSLHSAFGRHNDCVVFEGTKLMRHFDPQTGDTALRAVFDVESDPREETIVRREFGAYGRFLLEAADTNGVEFPRRFERVSPEDMERMKSLGYFDG